MSKKRDSQNYKFQEGKVRSNPDNTSRASKAGLAHKTGQATKKSGLQAFRKQGRYYEKYTVSDDALLSVSTPLKGPVKLYNARIILKPSESFFRISQDFKNYLKLKSDKIKNAICLDDLFFVVALAHPQDVDLKAEIISKADELSCSTGYEYKILVEFTKHEYISAYNPIEVI